MASSYLNSLSETHLTQNDMQELKNELEKQQNIIKVYKKTEEDLTAENGTLQVCLVAYVSVFALSSFAG